jgi:hypothetical protein
MFAQEPQVLQEDGPTPVVIEGSGASAAAAGKRKREAQEEEGQEQEEHGSLRQQPLFERIPFDERGIDDQPAAAYDDEPLGRKDWEDNPWPLTTLTSEQEASLCELGPEAYRS